jgi:hypothetical protein
VSWRTVYRTVIKRVVETIRVLVTMFVLLVSFILAALFNPSYAPVLAWVTKQIVRYIKEIIKVLVKAIKLIRILVRGNHDRKSTLRLAAIGRGLDDVKHFIQRVYDAYKRFLEAVREIIIAQVKAAWDKGLTWAQKGLGWLSRHIPFHDAINRSASTVAGWAYAGIALIDPTASCHNSNGLRVCNTFIHLYGGSGTTVGDTYVTGHHDTNPSMLEHEKAHRDLQWRRYGGAFGLMYVAEMLRTGFNPCNNRWEQQADLGKGSYNQCLP